MLIGVICPPRSSSTTDGVPSDAYRALVQPLKSAGQLKPTQLPTTPSLDNCTCTTAGTSVAAVPLFRHNRLARATTGEQGKVPRVDVISRRITKIGRESEAPCSVPARASQLASRADTEGGAQLIS